MLAIVIVLFLSLSSVFIFLCVFVFVFVLADLKITCTFGMAPDRPMLINTVSCFTVSAKISERKHSSVTVHHHYHHHHHHYYYSHLFHYNNNYHHMRLLIRQIRQVITDEIIFIIMIMCMRCSYKGRHQNKKTFQFGHCPKMCVGGGGGGVTLARIFWTPFFDQLIVPKKVIFYPKLTTFLGF